MAEVKEDREDNEDEAKAPGPPLRLERQDSAPLEFCDVITLQLMERAVILGTCGHSFDERSIRDWLTKQLKCPICETATTPANVMPNFSLRDAIAEFHNTPHHRSPKMWERIRRRVMSWFMRRPGRRIRILDALVVVYVLAAWRGWPGARTVLPSASCLLTFPFSAVLKALLTLYEAADAVFLQLAILLWDTLWGLLNFLWVGVAQGVVVPVFLYIPYFVLTPLQAVFGLCLPIYRCLSLPVALSFEAALPAASFSSSSPCVTLNWRDPSTLFVEGGFFRCRDTWVEVATALGTGAVLVGLFRIRAFRTLIRPTVMVESNRLRTRVEAVTRRCQSLWRRATRNINVNPKAVVVGCVGCTLFGYVVHLLVKLSFWYHRTS